MNERNNAIGDCSILNLEKFKWRADASLNSPLLAFHTMASAYSLDLLGKKSSIFKVPPKKVTRAGHFIKKPGLYIFGGMDA